MFSPKLMILKGFPKKGRKGAIIAKSVFLYMRVIFLYVYMHIYFFYLLIHKKCNFIKHCALFVKIRGIIYINQSFTAGRNVSTLRPFLRPFCHDCALFTFYCALFAFLGILSQTNSDKLTINT